jgi:hypothetical protein
MDIIKNLDIFNYLIGMTPASAEFNLDCKRIKFRVIEIDGKHQEIHADFKPWRINVKVKDGLISEIDGAY